MPCLRPFFSYYGSKFEVCKKRLYPTPLYGTIVEPFAGAAGYSVNNFQRDVRLYDVDECVYGVWHYLIHAKQSEIRRLPTNIRHWDDLPDWVPQEAKWLIGYWLVRAQPTPRQKASTWMIRDINRGAGNIYWSKYVRGMIAHQVKYIRHWKVFHKSYEDCPNREATWFVDPPYQCKAGRSYKHNKVDFDNLSEWCIDRKGQVIVCEGPGANWLPFRPLKSIKAAVRKGRKVNLSKELIWVKSKHHIGFINFWSS